LTINHERQKPLFCPKTLARQALEPQVFRPESLRHLIDFTLTTNQPQNAVILQRVAHLRKVSSHCLGKSLQLESLEFVHRITRQVVGR